jgi:hypothetical protein
VATGFLLLLVGVWIVFRSVRGERTLPAIILGK